MLLNNHFKGKKKKKKQMHFLWQTQKTDYICYHQSLAESSGGLRCSTLQYTSKGMHNSLHKGSCAL